MYQEYIMYSIMQALHVVVLVPIKNTYLLYDVYGVVKVGEVLGQRVMMES